MKKKNEKKKKKKTKKQTTQQELSSKGPLIHRFLNSSLQKIIRQKFHMRVKRDHAEAVMALRKTS